MIPQTLNISDLRTTSAKSINLYTLRKFIKYFFKNARVKAVFTFTVFEILLFKVRSVSFAQRETGSKRVKISLKKQKKIGFC